MTAPSETGSTLPRPRHHTSHSGLLVHESIVGRGEPVDAVVVPTARPAPYLRDALHLAKALGCPVLALCSRRAGADRARQEGRSTGAYVIAADVPEFVDLPVLETSALVNGGIFRRNTDTSLKRNIAIAVARLVGWRRIVFIDDDITDIRPDDIRAASALLDSYDMVGLENIGFPDNSVVCHALRAIGKRQECFVGGGAMAVNVDTSSSYFPNIYNEDWFYLVDDGKLRRTAVTGKVSQKWFDPYDRPNRARGQEFGDCLAEGLFSLLDDRTPDRALDPAFWGSFLEDRQRLIAHILDRIPALDRSPAESGRMIESMKAAQGRRQFVTPELCVTYMKALEHDRELWRSWLAELPAGELTPRKALQYLGLESVQIAAPVGRSDRPGRSTPTAPLAAAAPRPAVVTATAARPAAVHPASRPVGWASVAEATLRAAATGLAAAAITRMSPPPVLGAAVPAGEPVDATAPEAGVPGPSSLAYGAGSGSSHASSEAAIG